MNIIYEASSPPFIKSIHDVVIYFYITLYSRKVIFLDLLTPPRWSIPPSCRSSSARPR